MPNYTLPQLIVVTPGRLSATLGQLYRPWSYGSSSAARRGQAAHQSLPPPGALGGATGGAGLL